MSPVYTPLPEGEGTRRSRSLVKNLKKVGHDLAMPDIDLKTLRHKSRPGGSQRLVLGHAGKVDRLAGRAANQTHSNEVIE
jgi:hypothetical protein